MKQLTFSGEPNVLFFDINETVLDVSPLRALIRDQFQEDLYALWFARLLHYSVVASVTGTFRPFGDLAVDAVKAVASLHHKSVSEAFCSAITRTLSTLPAYPEVAGALQSCKEKGYTVVALSNSSTNLLQRQLDNAGLSTLFDAQISVELFQTYKPDPKVYRKAAFLLRVPEANCRMVAAHDWDVYGALCAGLKAVYVERGRTHSYFLPVRPDWEVADLEDFAHML